MAGGNGGNGSGVNPTLGGAGGTFGIPGGSTSKTSSAGAGGGGAGAAGGNSNGTGGAAGRSGTAQHPGGSAGHSGNVSTAGVGGGGGGDGILFTAGGVLATAASFGGGSGGSGSSGTAGKNGRSGGGGGEGGYGIAAPGAAPTTVDIEAGEILITGGNGGSGGASLLGAKGGSGGDGGIGVYLPTSGSTLNLMSGKITGGDGGAAGLGAAGNGSAGMGGAGVVGANLAIVTSGTIAGGHSGGLLRPQADAIDLTGGTNALTLSSGGTQGTLNGGIGVTGSLAIDPGTTTSMTATLTNVIHDTANGAGNISKTGAATLTLSGQSTYSGGTTLDGGTLELSGATNSKTDIGPGLDAITYGAAGTGTIAFGESGSATLQVDDIALTNPGGSTSYLAYALTGFAPGDVIDLKNLGATGATVSYSDTDLTVTANGTSDRLDINAAPTGYKYTTMTDASGAGIDVVLAPTSKRKHTNPTTSEALAAPLSGQASWDASAATDLLTGASDAGDLAANAGNSVADASPASDMVLGHHQAGTGFVFSPGVTSDLVDRVRGFVTGGAGHSMLDLPSADFADLATVFANTSDMGGSAFITDPVTGGAVRLAGVTAAELKQHPKDITFHA